MKKTINKKSKGFSIINGRPDRTKAPLIRQEPIPQPKPKAEVQPEIKPEIKPIIKTEPEPEIKSAENENFETLPDTKGFRQKKFRSSTYNEKEIL